MPRLRTLFGTFLLGACVFGLASLLAPVSLAAKGGHGGGGGGGGGGGNPPDCPCEEVLQPAPGVTCTLDWCVELVPGGFECGYTCTLPY